MLNNFIKHNIQVSRKNKIKHIFLNKGDENIPQYWWKVFMIDNLMREFPDFDLIMWLDSDAYFVNYSSTNI